jgi:hypothetical protein
MNEVLDVPPTYPLSRLGRCQVSVLAPTLPRELLASPKLLRRSRFHDAFLDARILPRGKKFTRGFRLIDRQSEMPLLSLRSEIIPDR